MKVLKYSIIFLFLTLFLFSANVFSYLLFDDFEDGDEFNSLKGVWYTISDDDEVKVGWTDYNGDGIFTGTLVIPGSSDPLLPVFGGANGSAYSLRAYIDSTISEYITGEDQTPYAGIGTSFGEINGKDKIMDLSQYYAVGFNIKSTGITKFKVVFSDVADSTYQEDYAKEVTITTNAWNSILVPFSDLSIFEIYKNNEYYASYPDNPVNYDTLTGITGHKIFNQDSLVSMTFSFTGPSVKGYFIIDNVYFLKKEEYDAGVLPVDSDHNGIPDGLDVLRLLNIHYTDTESDTFNLTLDFNRSDVKGKVDVDILDMNGGLLKHLSYNLDESMSAVQKIISKISDNGAKIKEGLYILQVKFSDNFGNTSMKKLGLALN